MFWTGGGDKMLNIISNMDEKAKLEDIVAFNQMVAWFLHDAFDKLGYPSRLVCDESNDIPIADNTLVVSAVAMVKMRTKPDYRTMVRRATRRSVTLYLDADFGDTGYPYNTIFTVVPPSRGGRFVYAGWGADPSYYYPDQKEKAVLLDRQHSYHGFPTEMARIYQTYLQVLPTTGAKIYRPPQTVRIPLRELQEMFRRCHYYCCTQYGDSGLTRIEAATCGALLVVPTRLYMPITMNPLSHAIWRTEADLRKIIATKTNPQAISAQARKQTWDLVARRIMARLG